MKRLRRWKAQDFFEGLSRKGFFARSSSQGFLEIRLDSLQLLQKKAPLGRQGQFVGVNKVFSVRCMRLIVRVDVVVDSIGANNTLPWERPFFTDLHRLFPERTPP